MTCAFGLSFLQAKGLSVVYGDCKIVGVNVPIFFANWKRVLVVILNLILYFSC